MKAVVFFRIAAVLLFLFAVGHTVGFLTLQPPTAEARAVRDAMSSVTFTMDGAVYSYGHFYRGFGLIITAFDLFLAWLAWMLGEMARKKAEAVMALSVPLIALQIVGAVLAWMYFGPEPLVLSLVLIAVLFVAMLLNRRETRASG